MILQLFFLKWTIQKLHPGTMKEGTANWGIKWLLGDLQTCHQYGKVSDRKVSKNHHVGDPTCGVTFDPKMSFLSPQIGAMIPDGILGTLD